MRNTQAGAALIITLLLTALLAFLGGALVFIIDVETAISANHRTAQEVRDAADSGIECAIAELSRLPDWTALPDGTFNPALRCLEPAAPARIPDGAPLNLARQTALLQAGSNSRYDLPALNPDSPLWVILARGPLRAAAGPAHPYVLVWVADDVDDGDGRPQADNNDVVILRAQAFGIRGAEASVEALVSRTDGRGVQPSSVQVIAWRLVR